MRDTSTYRLPWENVEELQQIATKIITDIHALQSDLGQEAGTFYLADTIELLEKQILELRKKRSDLLVKDTKKSFDLGEKIEEIIQKLQNIRNLPEKPSIALEKYVFLALIVLNDAIRIQTNAPLGDDNELTYTAPANVPDIECEYLDFHSICEVTMLTGRNQWYNEGQPVMRHLRDFESRHRDKPTYCLFVSPSLHQMCLYEFVFDLYWHSNVFVFSQKARSRGT
ncbi:MAG: AlwI family type II restriction endonuclease [Planctomycetia bacterium]|nr:AlwI family type II restriction endonuclease [Planctomycetia bacterium]